MSTWMVTSRNRPMRRIGIFSMACPLAVRRRRRFAGRRATSSVLRSASVKASASVALVDTADRSTPRCTMVCAICGRMPLMMQSAPIRRAAATVFSRCWATSVSTVGTPVMSMIAMAAPVRTIACSRLSITTCVRALSSVPMSGSARMPFHSSTTGVESSSSSCCWRLITSSRLFWNTSVVNSASLSRIERGGPRTRRRALRGVLLELRAQASEQRLLERQDEGRGLGGREALQCARARHAGEEVPNPADQSDEAQGERTARTQSRYERAQ